HIDKRGIKLGKVVSAWKDYAGFDHEPDSENEQIVNFSDALAEIHRNAHYSVCGSFEPEGKEKKGLLYIKKPDGGRASAGTWLNPDIEVIKKYATPSSYGDLRTQTTVHDPSVRLAMEIDAKSLKCLIPFTSFQVKDGVKTKVNTPKSIEEARFMRYLKSTIQS